MDKPANNRAGALLMLIFVAMCIIFALPFTSFEQEICDFLFAHGFACNEGTNASAVVPLINPVSYCDGNDLVISFPFNQPMNGNYELDWQDDMGKNTLYTRASGETSLDFRIAGVLPGREVPSIRHIWLILEDGTPYGNKFYERTFGADELHWAACSTHNEEQVALPDAIILEPVALPTITPVPNPDGIPVIFTATCLQSKQLMLTFQFEKDVSGEYDLLVADISYQGTPVKNQPQRLFFFGNPPPEGPIKVRLVNRDTGEAVLEESYTPPVCTPSSKPKEKKDNDTYHVPGE